ncbi:hypothetical protein QM012_008849 [Aureobasidium pullulans]|uniref:Uncharacterized protein n=1 Tax=Aureobasidium pullulans TaxID=5580 RepID=A0ABR0TIB6_AURPU
MAKSKRTARASWLFRNKPAVASAHDTFGRFNVSINHDESKSEGSIVIQHAVHLEGFSSEQTLDLVLRPESIVACELYLDNQNHRLPPEVLNLMPTNRNDILSLSLTMHTPGTVICPTAPLPLSFVSTGFGRQFAAYSHLCQTTQLRIYLGKDQLQPEHRARLERFASATTQHRLRANPIDLRSLGGGGGKQETTWEHIHPSPEVEQQAVFGASRKRSRYDSNSQEELGEPSTKIQKFFWDMVPPGSPTEINTPSSRHLTPTITTTNTPDCKLMHPFVSPRRNRGVGDEPRLSMTGDGSHNRQRAPGSRASTPLPAYPTRLENTCTPSPALEKTSSPAWGSSIEIKPTFLTQPANNTTALSPELTQALGGILQQTLPNIIEGAFSSILAPLLDIHLEALINHKMEALVQEKLPQLTHHALQQTMDKYIDSLEDEHKRAEVEIGETVDEAKTEINDACDRGIDDIETWAQERFEEFEDEVVGITKSAVEVLEDKTNDLKERLDRKFECEYLQSSVPFLRHSSQTQAMTGQIYCHLCGGPFLENDNTWLGQVVMLSTGHQTQNGIEIDDFWPFALDQNGYHVNQHASKDADRVLLRLHSAYNCEKGTFCLLGWDEEVRPSISDHLSSHHRGGSLYLPVHNVCLQLADRFINTASTVERDFRNTTSGRITSELQLWEVLYPRVDQFGCKSMTNEPHNFFLPPGSHSGMPWGKEYDSGEFSFLDSSIYALLMANPLEIPNITHSILENLKAIPDTEPLLHETQDESCDSLANSKAYPWLWDLDTLSIRAKQKSSRWEWESLLRSLWQPDVHMPSDESLDIPLSLRNRRRIWRILEEARVNDLPITRR